MKNQDVADNAGPQKKLDLGGALKDATKTGGGALSFAGKLVKGVVKSTLRTALGPVSLIAGAIAWFKTPAFVGGAGVLKSLGVGVGTSIGGSIGAMTGLLGGLLGGGAIGAAVGGLIGRGRGAVIGAVAGMGIFGIGGAITGDIVGMVKGYEISKEAIMEKFPSKLQELPPATTTFNVNAEKPAAVETVAKQEIKAPAVSVPVQKK